MKVTCPPLVDCWLHGVWSSLSPFDFLFIESTFDIWQSDFWRLLVSTCCYLDDCITWCLLGAASFLIGRLFATWVVIGWQGRDGGSSCGETLAPGRILLAVFQVFSLRVVLYLMYSVRYTYFAFFAMPVKNYRHVFLLPHRTDPKEY